MLQRSSSQTGCATDASLPPLRPIPPPPPPITPTTTTTTTTLPTTLPTTHHYHHHPSLPPPITTTTTTTHHDHHHPTHHLAHQLFEKLCLMRSGSTSSAVCARCHMMSSCGRGNKGWLLQLPHILSQRRPPHHRVHSCHTLRWMLQMTHAACMCVLVCK